MLILALNFYKTNFKQKYLKTNFIIILKKNIYIIFYNL